jgi:Hemerythrin HHE cation binding domain
LRRLLGLLFAPCKEQALTEVKRIDALELLKQDHQKVKGLFKETEGAENSRKKQLFDQIDIELEIHAHIEETVFYPAIEKHEELKDMVAEARERACRSKDAAPGNRTAGFGRRRV